MFGRFELQAGGWVLYEDTDFEPTVWVRFAEGAQGRLEVVELHMGGAGIITGQVLRAVNPGRLEAAANSPDVAAELRQRIAKDRRPRRATERFLGEIAAAAKVPESEIPTEPASVTIPGAREPARKRPDDFYVQVAAAFAFLSRQSDQPAQDLANDNGVPVSTVHRWVKESRRRGLLAPARRAPAASDPRVTPRVTPRVPSATRKGT